MTEVWKERIAMHLRGEVGVRKGRRESGRRMGSGVMTVLKEEKEEQVYYPIPKMKVRAHRVI